jgi:RHS repeat-associated protein
MKPCSLSDITSYPGYYPFGMLQRSGQDPNASNYRYGYNGKEQDDEVKGKGNQLDFGARAYDPRLGRFFALDPKTATYSDLSPYCYAGNTPIQAIDDNGEGPIIVIHSAGQSAKLKAAIQNGDTEKIKVLVLYGMLFNPVDDSGNSSDYMERMIKGNGSYEGAMPRWGIIEDIGTTGDVYTRFYGFNIAGDYVYLGKIYIEPVLTDEQKKIQEDAKGYELSEHEKKAFEKWKNQEREYNKSVKVKDDANELTEKQLWQAFVASMLVKDKFKQGQSLISESPRKFYESKYTLSEISEGSFFKSIDSYRISNLENSYGMTTTYGIRSGDGYEKISGKQLELRGISTNDLPTVDPKSMQGKEKR